MDMCKEGARLHPIMIWPWVSRSALWWLETRGNGNTDYEWQIPVFAAEFHTEINLVGLVGWFRF
jgi:hypothetical protein